MRAGFGAAGPAPGVALLGLALLGFPMLGFAMLGMSCVPGTPPRLMPLGDESGLGERDDAAAFSNESGRVSTLLVASGETFGTVLGSPTPGVVDASSSGTDGGGP